MDIGSFADPVLCIDPVTSSQSHDHEHEAHQIITVQRSGRVTCIDSKLTERRWSVVLPIQRLSDNSEASVQRHIVSVAFVAAFDGAEGSLFKYHPYILDQLRGPFKGGSEKIQPVTLVGVITKATATDMHADCMQIFALHQPIATSSGLPKVSCICDWLLPQAEESFNHTDVKIRFNLKRGLLARISHDRLQVIDIFRPRAKSVFEHMTQGDSIVDCVIINRSLCFFATARQCVLADMQYQTVQATRVYSQQDQQTSNRKRKRDTYSSEAFPRGFLHYFEKSSIVAGVAAQNLTSSRVVLHPIDGSNKKRKQIRLADALGHGRAVAGRDVSSHQDGPLKGLSSVFEWASEPARRQNLQNTVLRVRKTDHKSFSSLVAKGHVTAAWIQQALLCQPGLHGQIKTTSPKDVVEALASYDPTLMLVAELVFQSPVIGLPMLSECLRLLLRSFEAYGSETESRVLEDVSNWTNGDLERELQIEEHDAVQELELASDLLENGLHVRASAIRRCFEKLATCFHLQQVSRVLKETLSSSELVLMIDFLRHEMRRGDLSSHAPDDQPDMFAAGNQSHAITAICELLGCAVDALGIGSLLSGQSTSNEAEAEAFVTSLRNEASAVLEGVQESSFFDGFLRDFLGYENVLSDRSQSYISDPRDAHGKESREYLNGLLEPAALPISTTSVKKVSRTRITQAGQIRKRSGKDIGRQIRQRIGPYSFETIRF